MNDSHENPGSYIGVHHTGALAAIAFLICSAVGIAAYQVGCGVGYEEGRHAQREWVVAHTKTFQGNDADGKPVYAAPVSDIDIGKVTLAGADDAPAVPVKAHNYKYDAAVELQNKAGEK